MLPNTIGRYTVQQQIGHGGMAFVYLAHDPNLNDRVVAIKILKEQHQDARFQQDFQKEAHMLADLEHPNILPIYEYGDDNGRSYIVMRYIANGSLKHHLQQALFSPQEASDILTNIASALDYTHSEGIIHRDIKLSNILLDERNIPLLADFGIGRLVDDTDTVTDIGSPPYMAPEQWARQQIDARTDVYQLGIMLFEMLTGQRPFPPGHKDEHRHHHLSTPIPPIHRINSQLSPRFDAIIQKAAHKKPARRYQSAGEFAKAFALAVEQSHDDNTVTEPDTRSSKRNNYKWMGAGGILLLMLMLAFLFGDKLQDIATVPITPSPTHTPVMAVADGAVETIPFVPLATKTPTPTSTPLPDTPVPTPTQPMPTDRITPAPTSTPSLTPTPLSTVTPSPTPTTDPYQLPLNPTAGSPWVREQDGMPMRFVPGGNLSLGASDADQDALRTHCERMGIASNCPERIVAITSPPYTAIVSAYWIDANEVTNGQYAICVADTICQPVAAGNDVEAAHDNYPVVNVNWDQARAYCEWAGGDLPSEAQWEYAARGPMQSLFPWGSKFDASNGNFCDKNCTYGYREEGGDDGYIDLAETGAYPNGHSWVNVANMAGNAGEWTLASSDDGQDTHMIRGGSWASYSDAMSTVSHIMLSPTAANAGTGFRCVLPVLP